MQVSLKTLHYYEQSFRKFALWFNVPCVTTITGAEALVEAIASRQTNPQFIVRSLQEIHQSKETAISAD